MLARLQALLVLLALAAAVAWSAWCWVHGTSPWTWVIGVALALAPHAPVLAIEFGLLAWLGRDPGAPRASALELIHAWAGEVVNGWRVFAWRQPFAADQEPDVPGQPGQPGRTGVLLLHGYVCNRGLWSPWLRLLRQRGVPCTALTLTPVFGSIDDTTPQIEAAVRDLARRTGRPPLIVAHSMGGLAARAWLAAQPDAAAADARVLGVVSIGTPHHGTWMARFGFSTNARQMRQGSRWLQALAAREPPGRAARFTCFYGHADNIVFPACTATLAGADNRHIPATAHVCLAFEPEVLNEVLRRLAAAGRDPKAAPKA